MQWREIWWRATLVALAEIALVVVLLAGSSGPANAAGRCTKTLAAGGNLAAFVGTLGPGDTGCLQSGATFAGGLNLSRGGSSSAQVTVTSSDPDNPATIDGRIVTHPGATYITFTNLKLTWDSGGQNLPSITIGSDHVSLTYDDIQNRNTSICVNVIADPVWGTAHGTLIDHDRIHNCGVRPVATFTSPGYYSHALYISGVSTTVTNNVIYGASGKGVLLRGSVGAYVANNTIDDNGAGVAFGDLTASNNEVTRNIVTNSNAACDCNAYGVFAWWGSTPVGSGNTFHDNCLHGNQQGDVNTSGGGFTAAANLIANPGYVDAPGRDYTLTPASGCLGDGPDTAQPGASAGGGSHPTIVESLVDGSVVSGPISWFVHAAAPTTSVSLVKFFVDGALVHTEAYAPYGAPCDTCTFDTATIADGAHAFAAEAFFADGSTVTTSATVTVANKSDHATVSESVGRGSGARLSGSVKWTASPADPSSVVTWVYFFLDGALYHAEQHTPYGAPCDTCSVDTTSLVDGPHTFTVLAVWADGSAAVASTVLSVANGASAAVSAPATDPAPS